MLLSQPASSLRLQKEGDDCIYQALVCSKEASGTGAPHSQSEKNLARKRGKVCMYLTDKQIYSGNNHIPPFTTCSLNCRWMPDIVWSKSLSWLNITPVHRQGQLNKCPPHRHISFTPLKHVLKHTLSDSPSDPLPHSTAISFPEWAQFYHAFGFIYFLIFVAFLVWHCCNVSFAQEQHVLAHLLQGLSTYSTSSPPHKWIKQKLL